MPRPVLGSDCESWSSSLLFERQQAERALPIKSRTGPTSVRRELEAAACAALALDTPMRTHTDCELVETGVKEILDPTAKKGTPTKREHSEVWKLIEERTRSLPTAWLEIVHVRGHAKEDLMRQGELWKNTGMPTIKQTYLLAKGAASGRPTQELIEAYLERAERTRRQLEVATKILEERDHLEDIAPQAEQDPEVTDEVRDMQKPVFYQVMERRALPSGAWLDKNQADDRHRVICGKQE